MKRIRLDRTIPKQRRVTSDAQYEIIDLNFEDINDSSKDFQLFDGDTFTFLRLEIYQIKLFQFRVLLKDQVNIQLVKG